MFTGLLFFDRMEAKGGMPLENLSNRVAALIKELGINRTTFAERINVSQAFVSQVCNGVKQPSDRTISDICREFSVNENWLRYGDGSMFVELSRDEEIARYLGDLLKDDGEDREFQRRFVRALSKLSESDWQMIQRFAEELAKKD